MSQQTNLFDVKPSPDINNDLVRVGHPALDVEGVGQGDEDGLFLVKGLGAGLDDPEALLELGLGGGELGVRLGEVLDFFVELLFHGRELGGCEGIEGDYRMC